MPTGDETYTPEIADEILERLSNGESLRAICRDGHMPAAPTVCAWVSNNIHGFAEQYARARDRGLDEIADELLEIADDGRNDWMERTDPDNPGWELNGEHVQRSRLRLDARKWYLSKLAPKRYGDRLELDGKLDTGSKSADELRAELAALRAKIDGAATDSA